MTVQTPNRRQVARIPVPLQFKGTGLERRLVRLVDLSASGARIEHTDPVNEGRACDVDLPPALGRGRLKGKVVWTKPHTGEQTFAGGTRIFYQHQTGFAFVDITAEQREVLAGALRILQTGELPHGT